MRDSKIEGFSVLLRRVCGCFEDNGNEDIQLFSNEKIQRRVTICEPPRQPRRFRRRMSRKTWYAKQIRKAQKKIQMMDPEFDEDLEIIEQAIPSTSTGRYSLSQSKMFRRESQNEDEMKRRGGYDDNQPIIEPVPSTSSVSHSASYQSLIREKNSLKFEIDNIGKVMTCCKTAVNRWLSVLDEHRFPEKEYLKEYEEGTDKLHELQCLEMELESKQAKIQELEKLRKEAKVAKKKVDRKSVV